MRIATHGNATDLPVPPDSSAGEPIEDELRIREERTLAIGREVFARSRDSERQNPEPWLDRRLMRVAMQDAALKGQIFRFIDVLPALTHPAQINGHLREYLEPVSRRLPGCLGRLVPWMPSGGWVGGRFASLATSNARRMARRFIAAESLPEAVQAVTALRRQSLGFTLDLLGEAVLSEAEADRYQRRYLELIDGLANAAADWRPDPLVDRDDQSPIPAVNVSVKLSSLYSRFDPIDPERTSHFVRERLRPVLRLARQRGVFVNIDMEQFSAKEATLQTFKDAFDEPEFRDWPDVGIAIQAYLKTCGDDLAGLAEWAARRQTPVWVRLVKGAYWDYETVIAARNDWPSPVYGEKAETDANYESMAAFLMEQQQWLRPAIASHNIRSIASAIAAAEHFGVPPRRYEFQMLYGMGNPIKAALVSMGHRVRVYTPFGDLLPGMAYLVRRLLENTSNESFLRAGFQEHLPEERLLMNPLELLRRTRESKPARAPSSAADGAPPGPFRNEPPSDFSQEGPRAAMRAALAAVHGKLSQGYPLVIGGQKIETGHGIGSINPSRRRQLVGTSASASVSHAHQAVRAAADAFPAWRDLSVSAAPACSFAPPRSCVAEGSSWRHGKSSRLGSRGARRTAMSPKRSTSASTTLARPFDSRLRDTATCRAKRTRISTSRAALRW